MAAWGFCAARLVPAPRSRFDRPATNSFGVTIFVDPARDSTKLDQVSKSAQQRLTEASLTNEHVFVVSLRQLVATQRKKKKTHRQDRRDHASLVSRSGLTTRESLNKSFHLRRKPAHVASVRQPLSFPVSTSTAVEHFEVSRSIAEVKVLTTRHCVLKQGETCFERPERPERTGKQSGRVYL